MYLYRYDSFWKDPMGFIALRAFFFLKKRTKILAQANLWPKGLQLEADCGPKLAWTPLAPAYWISLSLHRRYS